MEICKECECNCRPVSIDCIIKNSDIQDLETVTDKLIMLTTSSIDDLIGDDCAEELCVALETAAEAAEAANAPDILPFLPDAWKNIITNNHFKAWYAFKLQWHFLKGASISEIISNKLISTSKSDPDYKDDYEEAVESERKRLERTSASYASMFKDKFLKRYWYKNLSLYACAEKPCGCKKNHLCNEHRCDEDNQEIGMWIG